MSLKRRPVDPFKIVSIHDDALDALPDRVVKEYAEGGREMAVLTPHLEKMKELPAVFQCEPLRAAYDAMALTNDVTDLRAIFAAHVRGIENAGQGNEPKFVDKGDCVYMDMAFVESLPPAIVIDVASEIVRRGMADTNPFTLPDTYWRARTRRNVRRLASEALMSVHTTETAKSPEGNT